MWCVWPAWAAWPWLNSATVGTLPVVQGVTPRNLHVQIVEPVDYTLIQPSCRVDCDPLYTSHTDQTCLLACWRPLHDGSIIQQGKKKSGRKKNCHDTLPLHLPPPLPSHLPLACVTRIWGACESGSPHFYFYFSGGRGGRAPVINHCGLFHRKKERKRNRNRS
ncbi:hypothetical protein P167DRAFT_109569 [Morchella conica CCBAS932]|uniref:Secreted protein n=1 Tax=Morchella conica CCBAS932 TaxID=1392247 RepID=A0A3N4KY87_9PEZI|nr:hypothetical protein P167DRAFT_109569 [Morchella conica CCBAS932]